MRRNSPRCLAAFMFAFFLGVAFNGQAQERHLSKKITVSAKSAPVEDVLKSIEKAGDFTFSYNADILEPGRKVTLSASDRNVGAVLTDIFGNRIRGKEVGNHVVLVMVPPRDTRPKEKTECSVTGMILEKGSGKALRDATIYEVGGKRSSLSRSDGRFTITFPDGENLRGLTICKAGYGDTVIFIRPVRQSNVTVYLEALAPTIDRLSIQAGNLEIKGTPPRNVTIDSMSMVNAFVPRKVRINSLNLHIFDTWPLQLSLVPYVSTNWKVSGSVNNAFSLNLLAGYSGGVRGFELGGLLNIDRNDVRGCQVGGLANVVGKNTSGVQVGGLVNINLGTLEGCQIGGLVNWLADTLHGLQLGGLFNYVPSRWKGAQIAGLVNLSLDHVTGFQLAGLVNIAREENRGVQVAGIFNYTRVLKGFQLAVFNYAGKVESGVPVGFLSIVRGGYYRLEVSGDEVFYGNLAVKTGTTRFYNIFKAGTNDSLLLNTAYGLGTLFPLGKKFTFSIDLTAGMIFSMPHSMQWYGAQIKLAPTFEYSIAKHFSLFLGPAFNFCFYSDAGDKAYPDGFPFYNFYDRYHSGTREMMWIGGVAGFRI